ncbi:MAG TPA: SAM-dependent methyltransferase, partial [Armatimonadota bacterium]|nr:SAM-dependent methyltransferase [Armatimonadota bacterium]
MPHDPAVLHTLRHRLSEAGRLTFAEVMETALYHPVGGYYTAHVTLGPAGDFVTAPEEHPAFGALLARQAAQCWAALGHPAPFTLVEVGGGRGTLAADLLGYARRALPDFAAAVQYRLVDRSPRLLAQQRARLRPFAGQVAWAEALPTEITGLILSNELIDAFP